MEAEIAAYKEYWETAPKDERNAGAEQRADAIVAAHPEWFAGFRSLTLPECVALVDVARHQTHDEDRLWLLEVWIMSGFEFQNLGGVFNPGGDPRVPPPPQIPVNGVRRTQNGG